jgi:RNA polymerase sigma-70 factor, ECF subfamily
VEERIDDAELARRIAAVSPGTAEEEEAELYRRLSPRVRLYGLRHLRDRQAAADLVQEVLLTTLEQLRAGKLRQPERLASFVFGICRLQVLEQGRRQVRHERLLGAFGDDLPLSDPSSAPRLDQARLRHCLEQLSERERSVLLLTFYDDRPARDVGVELGVSEGNVRVIRHRGLERLRACVGGGKTP